MSFICELCSLGPLWVVFPPDQEEIEVQLLKRPLAANRNWRPGETVDGLKGENRKHGVN